MKKRFVPIVCVLFAIALGGSFGCKAENEITPAPTAVPKQPDVIVNNNEQSPDHTIEVSGYGEVIAAPDFAAITLRVQGTHETAEEATLQCEALTASAIDVAMSHRVTRRNITTAGVTLNTNQRESDGAIIGYLATDAVTIILNDVSAVNALLSAVIDADVTENYTVTYSLTDTSAAYHAALTAAMEDALAKATSLAAAGNVPLGAVIGVTETPGEDYKLVGFAFETSQIAVSAKVTVQYKIP